MTRMLMMVPVLVACSACAGSGASSGADEPVDEAAPGAAVDESASHDLYAYPLIPFPSRLEPGAGWFRLEEQSRVVVGAGADDILNAAERWAQRIRAASGLPLPVARATGDEPGTGAIVLRIDSAVAGGEEAYRLSVTPETVSLTASAPAGLFRGLQTLRQLLPPTGAEGAAATSATWAIPAVEIEDAPRFSYRGMHLDVGRHVFPVEFIKKYLDLMALYKFNTFHWHLTEDQGWRLEIKKYPRLTTVGSCRDETVVDKNFDPYLGDGQRYCGFYTQEEAREIVEYASERFIRVIPEIEMPGHSTAALAAYPELACTEGPFEVVTVWGIHEDIYCPSEETFAFLEDVLTEVMAIFPSEYIHIGGDEAPKTRWEESEVAQAVMRREGLETEEELQSYFIRRIEQFLNENGRRLIGWDEILEGGLAPNATVMSWRGEDGGIAAAKQGHDVVMTPNDDLYLDHYQADPESEPLAIGGLTTLEDVYRYEPVPDVLTVEEARHVLGAQGNVWTEYLKTPDKVEYMVFPRLLALSEVVWSPSGIRDWDHFMSRLGPQLARLDVLDVNYRRPEG